MLLPQGMEAGGGSREAAAFLMNLWQMTGQNRAFLPGSKPLELGDGTKGAGNVNISSNTAKHINNTHNPNTYAQQLKFKPQDAAIKELQNKSFFNSSWSSTQIENAVNSGYNQAIGKGISTGTYSFTHAGETITIALENGVVQTAWGLPVYISTTIKFIKVRRYLMFKINYRIVDDLAEIKSIKSHIFDSERNRITGFFKLCFGEQKEGCYYHENPLQEGETGGELLNYWFNYLLETVNNLPLTKYAAFKELETLDRWLEFKLLDNNVMINVAIDKEKRNNNLFITDVYNGFSYVEPLNFFIEFTQFKDEVTKTISHFIIELKSLNPDLLKTKLLTELSQKISG